MRLKEGTCLFISAAQIPSKGEKVSLRDHRHSQQCEWPGNPYQEQGQAGAKLAECEREIARFPGFDEKPLVPGRLLERYGDMPSR